MREGEFPVVFLIDTTYCVTFGRAGYSPLLLNKSSYYPTTTTTTIVTVILCGEKARPPLLHSASPLPPSSSPTVAAAAAANERKGGSFPPPPFATADAADAAEEGKTSPPQVPAHTIGTQTNQSGWKKPCGVREGRAKHSPKIHGGTSCIKNMPPSTRLS